LTCRPETSAATLADMTDELTALPESFAAGTTIKYTKSFASYPADDGWTLTLYLAGATAEHVDAVADGAAFDVTIAATLTSSPFQPGLYKWSERVSKSGEVYEVAFGVVEIKDNLAEATDGSSQEWLERAIPVLRAHVEGRLTAGMQSYSIAGRAVSKIPVKEAVDLLTLLESRLKRLKHPGRISRPGLVQIVKPGTNQ